MADQANSLRLLMQARTRERGGSEPEAATAERGMAAAVPDASASRGRTHVLCASPGRAPNAAMVTRRLSEHLARQLREGGEAAEVIDGGAGLDAERMGWYAPDRVSWVVTAPEAAELANAYGIIRTLHQERGIRRFRAIVNRVTQASEAHRAYARLRDFTAGFLDAEIIFGGYCCVDNARILLNWGDDPAAAAEVVVVTKTVEEQHAGGPPTRGKA